MSTLCVVTTGFYLITCSPTAGSSRATSACTTEPTSRYVPTPASGGYHDVIEVGHAFQVPTVAKTT
ncbi:MAG: hypothetical protein QW080_04210 [Sulfolobales archaeon]